MGQPRLHDRRRPLHGGRPRRGRRHRRHRAGAPAVLYDQAGARALRHGVHRDGGVHGGGRHRVRGGRRHDRDAEKADWAAQRGMTAARSTQAPQDAQAQAPPERPRREDLPPASLRAPLTHEETMARSLRRRTPGTPARRRRSSAATWRWSSRSSKNISGAASSMTTCSSSAAWGWSRPSSISTPRLTCAFHLCRADDRRRDQAFFARRRHGQGQPLGQGAGRARRGRPAASGCASAPAPNRACRTSRGSWASEPEEVAMAFDAGLAAPFAQRKPL